VYQAGDPSGAFFVIDSGVFEVQHASQPRQRLGKGDYFGEQALIHDGPRESTVAASVSGRVFEIDRQSFHATLEHDVETRDRIKANLGYRHELAGMRLFRHLTATEREVLLEHFEPLTAERGTEIIKEGERGDRFYLIRTGTVKVLKHGSEVAKLGPGEAFGEMALLLDVPRTATVRATTRTELLALGSEQFHDLLLAYCRKEGSLERLSHLRMVAHKRSNHEVHRHS